MRLMPFEMTAGTGEAAAPGCIAMNVKPSDLRLCASCAVTARRRVSMRPSAL